MGGHSTLGCRALQELPEHSKTVAGERIQGPADIPNQPPALEGLQPVATPRR